MIGRTNELKWLQQCWDDGVECVQLVGPPGIGKSTLVGAFRQGRDAVWVGLETLARGSVLSAVATALSTPTTVASVRSALQERDFLVLDGAEGHVEEVESLVAELVPSVRVFITSRHRLRCGRLMDVGPLGPEEARTLFLEAAARVSSSLPEREMDAVDELVKRLEGWPLPLELAASRLRLYSPAELLEADPLVVLSDSGRSGRHSSLEGALQVSWDLLDEHDRLALSRLALPRGWFTREGFLELTGLDVEALERLMDASLVRWRAMPRGRRYALFPSVREFALKRLPADDPARIHYGEIVLQRAEQALERACGPHAGEGWSVVRRLQPDLESLLDSGHPRSTRSIEMLTELALANGPILPLLGVTTELLGKAQSADENHRLARCRLALLLHAERTDEAVALAETLEPTSRVLRFHAGALRERDLRGARELYEKALSLSEDEGDVVQQIHINLALGVVHRRLQDIERSQAHFEAGLALAREREAVTLEAVAVTNLALLHSDRHGYDAALRDKIHRAYTRVKGAESPRIESQIAMVLAVCDADLGHPDAEDTLAEIERTGRKLGDLSLTGIAALLRGLIAFENDKNDVVHAVLTDTLATTADLWASALRDALKGMVAFSDDDLESAAACFERARSRFAEAQVVREVDMYALYVAAVKRQEPPEPGDWPAQSPLRTAHELVRLGARGTPIPRGLAFEAAGSLDTRMILRLVKGAGRVEVARDGSWFVDADGKRVDLGRKRVLKRVLAAFARHAGEWISLDDLLREGWPGEVPRGDSGKARVHVAVSELRKMGLRAAIVTSPERVACYQLQATVREP